MPNYDDHINPPERTESAISKSLGQMALTMGLFVGGQALAMLGFAAGKSRAFRHLKKIPTGAGEGFAISKAAKHAISRGNSLTAFLSKVTKKDSVIGKLSRGLDAGSHNTVALKKQKDWAAQGYNKYEKYKAYKKLDSVSQAHLKTQWTTKYVRETAFLFPSFYAMEQGVGLLTPGPEHMERPAWYNIPGHAVNMVKYAPLYLAGDVVGRGLFKGIGAGMGYMAEKLPTKVPEIAREGIVRGADYLRRGTYLEKQVGVHKVRDYAAGIGAMKDAFVHAVLARPKMLLATQKTASRMERSGASFRNVRRDFKDEFLNKYDVRFKQRLEAYTRRKERAGKDTIQALETDFDDFLDFANIGVMRSSSEYARVVQKPGQDMGELQTHLKTSFFKENRKLPYMARLLGLRRAKGSDYKENKILGKAYDNMKEVVGKKQEKPWGMEKDTFINDILSKNRFIHEGTGLTVDIAPMGPKYWSDKMLRSKLLVLGNKFSISDLFPFKAFTAPEMHRVMAVDDLAALHPSSQFSGGVPTPYVQGKGIGSVVTHKNVHEFKKGAPGLLVRRAGDKSYNLLDYIPDLGGWSVISKNLKPGLTTDSPKLTNVFIRGQIRQSEIQKNIGDTNQYSTNPLIGWMQKHLSLFDNAGESPSAFSRLRMFLPDSVNKILSPTTKVPHSFHRATKTMQQLAEFMGKDRADLKGLGGKEKEEAMHLFARVRSLGSKITKTSFDDTLSKDEYMSDVIDFLNKQDIIKGISGKQAVGDNDALLNIASKLMIQGEDLPVSVFGDDKAVMNILKGMRVGNRGIEGRGGFGFGEEPMQKIKRYIYEYAVYRSETSALSGKQTDDIFTILTNRLKIEQSKAKVSPKDMARTEFGMFYDKLRYSMGKDIGEVLDEDTLKALGSKRLAREFDQLLNPDTQFMATVRDQLIKKKSLTGGDTGMSVMDAFTGQLGKMETTWNRNVLFNVDDMTATVAQVRNANPFTLYPGEFKSQMGLAFGWAGSTVNKLVSFTGLGWDPSKYNTGGEAAKLWGKRATTFAGAALGYSALDTFVDTSSLFDWTMFDEGLTVGMADQAVRARLASGWAYDRMGIDNLSRHLEGMMPGFTKVAPGAAAGFAMGGIKGAVIGGLANAYLQPQLEEGPLSFLAAIPGANFFVTDPTLSFGEIQDVYEGQRMLPVRKGRGWTLGITPIAGGRVERYEPGWYPRLKSQYKASPTLYGSKLEQFLAKDVPLVDFSLMDLIDPHYLEYKHMTDRPYPIASTPFSEVPVMGPILGATAGQLYNFVHPLGQVAPMQKDRAMREYMKGTSTNWRGESLATYGPQYGGFLGAYNPQNTLAGNAGNTSAIMSPHSIKPLIGEQIYKGWIEPLGLPGFITSAMLWKGDEPYTHIPIAESANAMDSLTRSYWDANLGDLVGSTELLRRAIPRPRTSYEKFNPLRNDMPGWMPETFQTGDPYCLHPDTVVETSEGLVKAAEVEENMLLKTLNGQYYPVNKISTRLVNEEIYIIKVKGLEDFPLKTTGGHPFYISGDWKFAKDIENTDRTSYPLFSIDFPNKIEIDEQAIELSSTNSYTLGLMTRWTTSTENILKLREETPKHIQQEITAYSDKSSNLLETIKYLQYTGIPPHLVTADLPVFLNYIKAFIVSSETTSEEIVLRFHNADSAYTVWSALLQHRISSRLEKTTITVNGIDAAELSYEFGFSEIKSRTEFNTTFDMAFQTVKHGPLAQLEIASIETEYYSGLVYTIDMGEAGTYTLPGATVHNSKIAHGELLLPGESYESFFNPDLAFPTGMSRLGYNPYDQAMNMLGLGHLTLKDEEVLEEGTAIHSMVQNQLMSAGLATRVEALISDPSANIRSFVDVMYKDPRTQQELPLEIKTINAKGFTQLSQPKWKHRVQLNSYMAAMGVSQGRFLYVSRDDPTQTKEFTTRFDPELWNRTKSNLREARRLAQNYLEQGYGYAQEGYSYLDRLRVLMNASPYSGEYRETTQLLEEQLQGGYLAPAEEEEFSTLKQQHKTILRKYEMYPRRFEVSNLLNPDYEYPEDLSLNPYIEPADQYNLIERVAGSAWESITHLRSPIHTKLIGAYTPLEQYENMMIRGDFASWVTPVESFVKPWSRGLISSSNPLQGAVSFGTGGAILGGLPGAVAGTVFGAAYGGAHGLYRSMSGSESRPRSFQDKVEMQEYFDKLEYKRALQMYRATQDNQYRKQMQKTQFGWLQNMQMNIAQQNASNQSSAVKKTQNPAYYGIGSDRGFGSPWEGSDERTAMLYNTSFYKGYSALPSWDRPFWSSLVETSHEDEQDRILRKVDSQMGDMLKMMWGRGEDITLPNLESYFTRRNLPSALNPVMDPTVDQEDIQMATVEDYGMNAHDFGLGWREQLNRIRSSHFDIRPLDINAEGQPNILKEEMSTPEMRDAIQKVLGRMGYSGANVTISSSPALSNETDITLNVKRTSARTIINDYYGKN